MKKKAPALSGKMDENTEGVLWGLGVYAAFLGVYMLFKREGPGVTEAGEVAPLTPPASFPTLGAVSTRFDEVRELYRMGYKTPLETLEELDQMTVAINRLRQQGVGDPASAEELLARMRSFSDDVAEFIEETAEA